MILFTVPNAVKACQTPADCGFVLAESLCGVDALPLTVVPGMPSVATTQLPCPSRVQLVPRVLQPDEHPVVASSAGEQRRSV